MELKQPTALLVRYEACLRAKLRTLVGGTARLNFFAAAERAIELGDDNPCGMFYQIVTLGLWKNISNDQEERARKKLVVLDKAAGGFQ